MYDLTNAENQLFDRIYLHPDTTGGVAQQLAVGRGLDPAAADSASSYELHQGEGFRNTVVFNPWTDGKRGPAHPDFDDDGYKVMRPSNAAKPFPLQHNIDIQGR